MPTTRKKVIKTVYKDEDDSEAEDGDFSDSGSEAVISPPSSSEDEGHPKVHDLSVGENKKKKKQKSKGKNLKLIKSIKTTVTKITLPKSSNSIKDQSDSERKDEPVFSIKDLTDEDKLLPSILNLSESDSSDDEAPPTASSRPVTHIVPHQDEVQMDMDIGYKDVWSSNLGQSEEIAQRAFLELEKHKTKLEETKQSIQNYTGQIENTKESNVKDLLALGEEIPSKTPTKIKKRIPKIKNDSDSDVEDWEEVAEAKVIPQQGLQLVVDFPDAVSRKSKKLDVEMMMKRKINRVKKEYQVYMHKVHVLCWIGHGNYVSQVLNDQDVMSAALSLIPSKECYPGERVDMKYVEQITTWFKDKLNTKYDKNEGKFRPKQPPLKEILLQQIKSRVVTCQKYVILIFVSMLRAVGLQCRIMQNFTTLPIKPPATELCSLSTKTKSNVGSKQKEGLKSKACKRKLPNPTTSKIPQLDGNYDSLSDSDFENIVQIDGNDDGPRTKRVKSPINEKYKIENENVEDVSPPKRSRRNLSVKKPNPELSKNLNMNDKKIKHPNKVDEQKDLEGKDIVKISRKSLSLLRNQSVTKVEGSIAGESKIYSSPEKKDKKITQAIKVDGSKDSKGKEIVKASRKSLSLLKNRPEIKNEGSKVDEVKAFSSPTKNLSLRKTRSSKNEVKQNASQNDKISESKMSNIPTIVVSNDNSGSKVESEYFNVSRAAETKRDTRARKRARTTNPNEKQNSTTEKGNKKPRAKSVPENTSNNSKYFEDNKTLETSKPETEPTSKKTQSKNIQDDQESQRVSHRDLMKTEEKSKSKNDVTHDLVSIIKKRVKAAKVDPKKGKNTKSSDEDSDYLPETSEPQKSTAPQKAKPSSSRKKDNRVQSTDDETPSHKMDTWCEIYVEELEQWIAVDIIKGRVHCVNEIYRGATHPVNYVVGWDNNNYLKDLTRRYVPHWNTVTRKQRVEPAWWQQAVQPWLGPRTARDREEDDSLDRLQLDAPLPKSITEYKNHPLYALKRHLLKFEVIYPPDAATLGFVRGEAVYARACVHVCRSRDTWLKEAKVVRLGEKPYKVVKARPKWDRLSNKLITDKSLEVFGPWQVQEYEPPVAQNGLVPRNAYGNVELFKECMLPKGTVHIKLPGLNRVARKLNIDCAPAMTGFDFNGGWSHPVFDGFVVCKEFEDIITSAWHEDQLEQERKEIEKLEARVYGNWRRLIKGLLIRERLKLKYGFSDPTTSKDTKKKSTGPRLTVKKRGMDK